MTARNWLTLLNWAVRLGLPERVQLWIEQRAEDRDLFETACVEAMQDGLRHLHHLARLDELRAEFERAIAESAQREGQRVLQIYDRQSNAVRTIVWTGAAVNARMLGVA